jgi:hypothetical protein
MRNLFFVVVLLWVCSLFSADLKLTADQILRKSENYRGFDKSFSLTVRIENFIGSEKKETTAFNVMVKSNTTSLAEQIEPPAARGRKLLMVENDMWLHTPDIKKAIRISLEQKLTGETSNGDIAKTNFYGDYEPLILETTAEHIKLQLDAKVSGTTYKQIKYFVNPKTYVPMKAEFLAASGKLLKTAVYGGIKKMAGRELVTEIRIADGLQKNRTSKLTYLKFKKEKMDDSLFNRSAL